MLCGDKIVNNAAGVNAFGGGLFFTSNNFGGTLTITDTTMTGNTGGHWTRCSRAASRTPARRSAPTPEHHHHELDAPGRAVAR